MRIPFNTKATRATALAMVREGRALHTAIGNRYEHQEQENARAHQQAPMCTDFIRDILADSEILFCFALLGGPIRASFTETFYSVAPGPVGQFGLKKKFILLRRFTPTRPAKLNDVNNFTLY